MKSDKLNRVIVLLACLSFLVFTVSADPFVNVAQDEDGPLELKGLVLCDQGTETVQEKATVCIKEGAHSGDTIIVDSVEKLNRENRRPETNGDDLTLLFFEPAAGQPKNVSIVHTQHVTQNEPISFNLGSFASNLIGKEQLLLKLEGEYYLLEDPSGNPLFSLNNVRLTHIPTKQQFSAENFPGTPWYLFNVLNQKRIGIASIGNQVHVKEFTLEESPAAYVLPQNLSKLFEITITKNTPVRITSPEGIGTLTICREDSDFITTQVFVCKNDESYLTLERETLTLDNDIALLYTYNEQTSTKEVHVFLHKDLDQRDLVELDQVDFAEAMVAQRRIAFTFDGYSYLLEQSQNPTLDLKKLSLTNPQEGKTLNAVGNELDVSFPVLSNGRLFLHTDVGDPLPPLEITAETFAELEPVDLDKELFTYASSEAAVAITNPQLGVIQAAEDEQFRRDRDVFNINIGGTDRLLHFAEPVEINDVLFYYNSITPQQQGLVKTAMIYNVYDLSDETNDQHVYDNEFIDVLTDGSQLALFTGGSYYLLGYEGEEDFFTISGLRLAPLENPTQALTPVTEGTTMATFALEQGEMIIAIDRQQGVMIFSLAREAERDSFTWELNLTNEVVLPTVLQNGQQQDVRWRMCFTELYNSRQSAAVCPADDLRNRVEIERARNVGNYLFESNRLTGDAKRVLIRTIIPLEEARPHRIPDWFGFLESITEGKPVFKVDENYYFPHVSGTELSDFAFGVYAAGAPQQARSVGQITTVTENATFVLGDRIIFMEQYETENEDIPLGATITLRQVRFVPDVGTTANYTLQATNALPFVTKLGGEIYGVRHGVMNENVATIIVFDEATDEQILFKKFREGESRRLYLDGHFVTITLLEIDGNNAVIELGR